MHMDNLRELRQRNLETIFHPKSVAVVGTNKVKGTVPHDILDNILKADFDGIVYPVSPREKSIKGIKGKLWNDDVYCRADCADACAIRTFVVGKTESEDDSVTERVHLSGFSPAPAAATIRTHPLRYHKKYCTGGA